MKMAFLVHNEYYTPRVMQLLKEAAPAITRIAVMAYRPGPGQRDQWRVEMEAAARQLRVSVLWVAADTPGDIDAALASINVGLSGEERMRLAAAFDTGAALP